MDVVYVGSYYKQNALTKSLLQLKKYCYAINLFVQCLFDYGESIKGNELKIYDCWQLCVSTCDARIGRTVKIIW